MVYDGSLKQSKAFWNAKASLSPLQRAARSKLPEDRQRIKSVVSAEFCQNSKLIDPKNFLYIEYLLRRGKKQLDQLKNPDMHMVGLSSLNVSVPQKGES